MPPIPLQFFERVEISEISGDRGYVHTQEFWTFNRARENFGNIPRPPKFFQKLSKSLTMDYVFYTYLDAGYEAPWW